MIHPDQNDVTGLNPMADVLAGMPGVWQRLLDEHVADSHGRCAACRNSSVAGVPWPCTLRVIAADARELYYAEPPMDAEKELSGSDACLAS